MQAGSPISELVQTFAEPFINRPPKPIDPLHALRQEGVTLGLRPASLRAVERVGEARNRGGHAPFEVATTEVVGIERLPIVHGDDRECGRSHSARLQGRGYPFAILAQQEHDGVLETKRLRDDQGCQLTDACAEGDAGAHAPRGQARRSRDHDGEASHVATTAIQRGEIAARCSSVSAAAISPCVSRVSAPGAMQLTVTP